MPIDHWWNFFCLCGSASVTLTGLTFISVTLGSTLIKKENLEQVNHFISPICFNFLHVFFLCCMTAIPGVNSEPLAAATILGALWRLAKMPKTYSFVRAQAKKDGSEVDLSDWLTIVCVPTVVFLILIASGTGFLLGQPWAVDALAVSCLVLLLSSAMGAWETVVWIAARLR